MRVRRLMSVPAVAVGLVLLGAAAPAWAVDSDGDGVDDAHDMCNNTPTDTAVDLEGRPRGDLDQDCDIDLDDFARFQQGFTGPLASSDGVIDMVPVGNPGNVNDTHGAGYGGVSYVYSIGKYEVTARQYTNFLNAVADTDAYGLYDTSMWSDTRGCKIWRGGSSGNYYYGVAWDWAHRPVNFVSWGDAARFANWLHNGQPTGDQDLTTTEDGSYFLDGAMSDADLLAITREPDATWVIPSEDEWYKAAYYVQVSGIYYYFDYPTASDTMPSNDLIDPDPGNNATFRGDGDDYTIGCPYYRTEVGAHENSSSFYGTFDQGGNVWEWNEAITPNSHRGLRGGGFHIAGDRMEAARPSGEYPSSEYGTIGFRVAEVP